MQPENIVTEEKHALCRVTPLSKYLALILFILMPFVGGWIGYRYAPVQVVEIDKSQPVTDSVKENLPLSSVNLQKKFSEQISDKYEIEPLYTTKESGVQYFKSSIPGSSACCGVYKYLPNTQSFYNTGIKIDMMTGEKESSGGRYIAKVVDGVFLEVYDLETQSLAKAFRVSDKETLVSLTCGYAGDSYDLKWMDENTLHYGVYKSTSDENCPKMELLEYRTLDLETAI